MPHSRPTRTKPIVLIVDDAPDSIQILHQILEADYQVLFATNGPMGLGIAQEQQPDVILLDVSMPGMDGHQVCRKLKEMNSTKEIPVIFVTGMDQDSDQEKGFQIGAADYLTKPVRPALVKVRVGNQVTLRQNEKSLRRAHKMEAVGQLTGGIAHDFNNILGIILGNLELLELVVADNPKATTRVRNTTKAALRAAALVKQLLGFSRIEAKNITRTNLNKVIQEMDSLITHSVTPQIRVNTVFEEKLWPCDIDQGDLEDALLNLIINARDAMPDGGELTIETSNQVLDSAFERNHPAIEPGDYVEIAVSDSGCGIPEKDRGRIFEPFFTSKDPGKGTGLGLSMVYGFVQRSRGVINAYSEPGVGTTFHLYLPRSTEMSDSAETAPKPPKERKTHGQNPERAPTGAAQPARQTLLIVGDEAETTRAAQHHLEAHGYQAILTSSAEAALRLLREKEGIDLLFSDINIPGEMNGYQLATHATQNRPGLKVLLTTDHPAAATEQTGQPAFEGRLLARPYEPAELLQHVREALREPA